jgi:hypothetical protein
MVGCISGPDIRIKRLAQWTLTPAVGAKAGTNSGRTGGVAPPSDREPLDDADRVVETPESAVLAAPATDAAMLMLPRRRGRPPKVREAEAEFVEWWKPGWRDRFR